MEFDKDDPDQALIVELRQSNLDRLNALAQRGIQLQIGGRAETILELILDAVCGDAPARIAFERDYAEGVAKALDQAEEQIRRQLITAGVSQDPKVVEQIARNAQTILPG